MARTAIAVPPLEGRANLAAMGLMASVGMHGMMAFTALAQLATGQTGDEGLLVIASGLVALLYVAVFITTVVLVCRWFHLATRHALAREAGLEVSTPGSAVRSWFIPFLNLVRPFNLTRQMLESAGLDVALVGVWQALWIAGNIAANLSNRIPGEAGLITGVVSDLLLVGAGLSFVQIVRKLRWAS